MFTGIIQATGQITAISSLREEPDAGVRLTITADSFDLADVMTGDSIAINGACMTVVRKDVTSFHVDVSRESLSCTAGLAQTGEVNLEKALRTGDRLGGHIIGSRRWNRYRDAI